MTKFIFVTGGVVSSLGKGIAAASLGALLQARGLSVSMLKMDPYINVNPGNMSPFEHGEVFVTDDGAETDLDLGHYERFVQRNFSKHNSFSAGQVYETVLKRERSGGYGGATVQVIPHITDEIVNRIHKAAEGADVAIVEVGGTVGDIESLPFLEAIRQLGITVGRANAIFIHLTLLPYIAVAGEVKTKPTQHSVKELRSIGIQPDILICRSEQQIPDSEKRKIALFTNVEEQAVISSTDAQSIYQIPRMLYEQNLDSLVISKLAIANVATEIDLSDWDKVVEAQLNATASTNIAIVGKYTGLTEAYKSLIEALNHAGIHNNTKVKLHYIDAHQIEKDGIHQLAAMDAILVPGGYGDGGIEGKISAIKFAREQNKPFLGIGLGMQLAAVEFARNVLGKTNANSTEFVETSEPLVIKGEASRLGGDEILLTANSKLAEVYGTAQIRERHRNGYEINEAYVKDLEQPGLVVAARSVASNLVEAIELPEHNWFIATQFQPEFTSTPRKGHPLFSAFVNAAKA